jgi:enterochelin esterase-like enzyme
MIKSNFFALIFLLLFVTASCTTNPILEAYPTSTNTPTQNPPDDQLEAAAPETCTDKTGKVERFEIDSENMNGAQYMTIYTPSCYDTDLVGGYPTLYVFNGQTFDDGMWFDFGVADHMDALLAAGDAQPFLIVSVFDEFYYRAVRGNKFPNAVIEEVVPWVDANFNTCTARECRAVGGISRGAAWAMRLGLTNPDIFGAIGLHSLPTYLGGPDQVRVWVEEYPKDQPLSVWMDSGRFDTEIKSAIGTEAVFSQKGFPHEWHLNEGKHDTDYWEANMGDYIRWYAGLWDE